MMCASTDIKVNAKVIIESVEGSYIGLCCMLFSVIEYCISVIFSSIYVPMSYMAWVVGLQSFSEFPNIRYGKFVSRELLQFRGILEGI